MNKNGDKATVREVYAIAQRLEDKIDLCVTKEEFAELCKEVKSLQNWKWKVTGVAGGVGAIFAFFTDKFMKG